MYRRSWTNQTTEAIYVGISRPPFWQCFSRMAFPMSQTSTGSTLDLFLKIRKRKITASNSAMSHTVPFDGHQLPRLVTLAHQHAPVGAVAQLSHGCVSVHRGKITQQKLLALLNRNLNAALFFFPPQTVVATPVTGLSSFDTHRLFPRIM